jgi:mannosylfructose-6-phosphate phosphatase
VTDATAKLLDHVRRGLVRQCVAAEVIYSSNRDLDVIPFGANKGAAATFLATHWNVPRSRVFVAGDSGNDRSLFLQGFRGIVVRNAQPELARLCRPDVHQASATFADGVIEGLNFWLRKPARIRPEMRSASPDPVSTHSMLMD